MQELASIKIIKEKIYEQEGVPLDLQRLFFNDVELEDVNAPNHYFVMKDLELKKIEFMTV